MVSREIWINMHSRVFQRPQIALVLRTRAILRSLKNSLVHVISKLHSKPSYYPYKLYMSKILEEKQWNLEGRFHIVVTAWTFIALWILRHVLSLYCFVNLTSCSIIVLLCESYVMFYHCIALWILRHVLQMIQCLF
jgi:hypothetical protein